MNDYEPDKYEKMFWWLLWITFGLALVLVLTYIYLDMRDMEQYQYQPVYYPAISLPIVLIGSTLCIAQPWRTLL